MRIGDQSVIPSYKEPILKLSFPNAGVYEVSIDQEFEDFPFIEDRTEVADTKFVTKVFSVTVVGPIRFSNIQGAVLNPDGTTGTPFNVTEEGLEPVTVGSTIRYTFTISGSVDTITATSYTGANVVPGSIVNDPTTGTGSVDIEYTTAGETYDVELNASRVNPEGNVTSTFLNAISVI